MTAIAETEMLPGMWWRCIDGSAHTLIFRADAPHQPHIQVTGQSWADLIAALEELGLTSEITEQEALGGHRPERPSLLEDHALELGLFYKGFRGKSFHFERRTERIRIQIEATGFDNFVEWCARFDIEVPPRHVIKTLRQLGIVELGIGAA